MPGRPTALPTAGDYAQAERALQRAHDQVEQLSTSLGRHLGETYRGKVRDDDAPTHAETGDLWSTLDTCQMLHASIGENLARLDWQLKLVDSDLLESEVRGRK